jgi:3-hydroxyisobutyrate dehydrogenase-like beta-hydroxyacid dehydrogenase
MMDFVKGYAVDGDPSQLAFSIQNAAKDVGYYAQMTQDAGVQSVMSAGALKGLTAATEDGRGDDMVSQIVDYYAQQFKG